jgi:hypothetical protein
VGVSASVLSGVSPGVLPGVTSKNLAGVPAGVLSSVSLVVPADVLPVLVRPQFFQCLVFETECFPWHDLRCLSFLSTG